MRAWTLAAVAAAALALLALGAVQQGIAQGTGGAGFAVAPQGNGSGVWVVDQGGGRVMLCSPPLQHQMPPDCTAWAGLR